MSAARRGDDRAFEQLYRRHRDQVVAELLRVVRDPSLAEDLAQDVFIAALRGIRAPSGPLSFRPWIREVARNAAIDSYRRSRRRTEVTLEQVAEQDGDALGCASAATPAPPDVVLERKHSLRQLRGAFHGLDAVHHDALVLRELEGRSYDEIGERLKLSGPAVESTLYRARRRLSAEYRELLSGERCLRVRALLDASAARGADAAGGPGARDRRALQRHVAWCLPCRSYAGLAGIAVPRTLPQRVGALLPLPGLAPLVAWWLRLGRRARGLGCIADRARGLGRHAGMVAEGVSRSGGDPISVASVPLIGVAIVLALGLGSDPGTKAQAAAHQHAAALNGRAGTSGGVLPGSDVSGGLPGAGVSSGPPSGAGATGSGSSGGARGGGAGGAGTGGSFGAGAGSSPAAGGSGPGVAAGSGGAQGRGSGLVSGAGGVVVSGAGGVVNGVVSGAGGVVNGVVSGAGGVVNGVVSGAGGVVNGVVSGAGGVVNGVVSGAGGVVNGVVSGAGGVVNGVVSGVVSGATSTVGKAAQSAGSAVQSVGSSVGKLPVVGASAGSTVSSAGGTVSRAASTVPNAGSAVASAGSSVSSTGTNAVTSTVSRTTSTVSGASATTSTVTAASSTVTAASSTITKTVSGLLSSGLGA